MKNLLRNNILYLLGACLAGGCIGPTTYHSYQSIPTKGWAKSDTLYFEVPLTDSTVTHWQLYAEVRNRSDYPYRDLYLLICHNLPDSTQWKTDTVKFVLADEEGKWSGTGWNGLFQSAIPVGTVSTHGAGKYTLKVTHGMKDEFLKGVNNVGIRLER